MMTRDDSSNGFTMIELLVAMSVLSLMVYLVAQLTNSATSSTANIRKLTDADGQARMVLDRMAADISRMVKRQDVDYIFAKHNGNDAFFFYSESPAYFDTQPTDAQVSTASVVGYRINSSYQLERYAKGLLWNASAAANQSTMAFLTFANGSAVPDDRSTIGGNMAGIGTYAGTAAGAYCDGTDSAYHVIGNLVIRMEISYLLSDGSLSLIPVTAPASTTNNLTANTAPGISDDAEANYTVGSRWYNASQSRGYVCTDSTAGSAVWRPIGIQDISAVIVTIAVLDAKSRLLISDIGSLASQLSDPTASGSQPKLAAAIWLDKLKSGSLATGGIPRLAISQLRVYQRYFYLNNP